MRNIIIFIVEILAITSFSFWAVAIEGAKGGELDKLFYNGMSANFLIFCLTLPLFLALPIIAKWFDSKLIGTLLTGVFVGGILEDFTWFVINPAFGIQKFNSTYATWLRWVNLGFFELPDLYIISLFLALLSWFVFIKNSKRIEKFYKTFAKKF